MSDHPGRVVTVEVLASLVSEAYAGSFTPVNIMRGFKKTGIWPINPGEVTDKSYHLKLYLPRRHQSHQIQLHTIQKSTKSTFFPRIGEVVSKEV